MDRTPKRRRAAEPGALRGDVQLGDVVAGESVVDRRAVTARLDEPRLLEGLEVRGHRADADARHPRQRVDRVLALGEQLDEFEPAAMRERLQHRRAQMLRMQMRKRALARLADAARRPHRVDDVRFAHVSVPLHFAGCPIAIVCLVQHPRYARASRLTRRQGARPAASLCVLVTCITRFYIVSSAGG